MSNPEIAELLNELADLLELQDENPFRVRAYRNASRIVATWTESLEEYFKTHDSLPKTVGLGADLSGKIREICAQGTFAMLEDARKKVPAGMLELIHVPGVGPKKARVLFEKARVRNAEELRVAAESGRLRDLAGFGKKTEENLLLSLKTFGNDSRQTRAGGGRIPLADAEKIAEPLVKFLRRSRAILQLEIAGSYRRRVPTVADLDVLTTSRAPLKVLGHFVEYGDVSRILSRGETRSTVLLTSGFQVDLRVVGEKSFGSALHYFTGSKAHNIAVRAIAQGVKLKLNEYGLFRGTRQIAGKTESGIFEKLGLRYIEPELRENRGEIEAAKENRLPDLIARGDLRVDFRKSGFDPHRLRPDLRGFRSRDQATQWVLKQVEHAGPEVLELGSNLNRLQLKPIFEECARLGIAVELLGNEEEFRLASACGVTFVLDPTLAESVIDSARRGWVDKKDVLNARSRLEIASFFSRSGRAFRKSA